jgi:hypothetical protein
MLCTICGAESSILKIVSHVKEEHGDQLTPDFVALLPFMRTAVFREYAGSYALNLSKFEIH